jgi:hypothetical protein
MQYTRITDEELGNALEDRWSAVELFSVAL